MKKSPVDVANNAVSVIFRWIFIIALGYVLIYPFLYMVINSLKDFTDAHSINVEWVPRTVYFGNIVAAAQVFDLKNTVLRTLIYEILASLLQFCTCAITAYGLARFKLKGKNIMIAFLILNILVPAMMIITPSYVNYSQLDFFGILGLISKIIGHDIRPNILGTPLVFYLPALFGVGLRGGLFIYIFMQFYKGLPKELEEAAAIDGAGSWKTFFRIVVPSSGAASITVILFSIVWHWNDFYLAQMYMSKPTFSVAINTYSSNLASGILGMDATMINLMNKQILISGCLLFVLPLLIFYLILQKKFVASIATSGIVG